MRRFGSMSSGTTPATAFACSSDMFLNSLICLVHCCTWWLEVEHEHALRVCWSAQKRLKDFAAFPLNSRYAEQCRSLLISWDNLKQQETLQPGTLCRALAASEKAELPCNSRSYESTSSIPRSANTTWRHGQLRSNCAYLVSWL
jgi:hypothetical protein